MIMRKVLKDSLDFVPHIDKRVTLLYALLQKHTQRQMTLIPINNILINHHSIKPTHELSTKRLQ